MQNDDPNRLIQDLFLLQRVGQRLSSNLNLDPLLEEIVNDVSQTFGCSRLAVLLKDKETNELIIGADCGGDANLYIKGERFKIGEYGMVGHVGETGETYYAPDVNIDPYYKVSDSQTRSEVDIPLKSRGELIGVLNAQHKKLNGFSSNRIKLLEALAGHITTAIENARMFERELREKERMLDELNEAKQIQQSFFPFQLPEVPGFAINGLCMPCREVGGDWYDFISFPDGKLGIIIADVCGKGMGAALLMSSTRTIVRVIAESGIAPGEVLSRVNWILLKDFPAAKFVTMIYAVLDPGKNNLTFANAGHLPPVLIDKEGGHFLETDSGLPLGIHEVSFSQRTVLMKEKSHLLFYSDGVTEAVNSTFEQYGAARLLNHLINEPISIDNILNNVNKFTAGNPSLDDLTMVMVSAKKI
ncbi:MAG: SpoIIE family protein phosphatase [Ignavibacteria bacterium]